MSTTQWIGVTIGLLILAARLPAVIWPGAYRDGLRAFLEGSGPGAIRALGAFLWAVVVTIVVLVLGRLSLLEAVLLVVAVLSTAAGAIAVFAPDRYQQFSVGLLGRMPDWAARLGGLLGVALGAWILVLSWRGR
jgi:hypothetical protein